MIMSKTITRLLLSSLFLPLLFGCNSVEEKKSGYRKMEKPTQIEFKFGEPFDSLVKRYPGIKIQKQPVGANFYTLHWPEEEPAKVLFKQGDYSVEIPYTISIMIPESTNRTAEGITQFHLNAGITYDKKIPHDEARLKFHEFLQGLLAKGWKRSLGYGQPRLNGHYAMNYMRTQKNSYKVDPTYLPTLKEWHSMKTYPLGTYWELHADNKAFIKIKVTYKTDKKDESLGIYLLEIEIINNEELGRAHFLGEEKNNWNDKKKWGALRGTLRKLREKKEKDLLSKGYQIDESYEDYEINPPGGK